MEWTPIGSVRKVPWLTDALVQKPTAVGDLAELMTTISLEYES
jgi:hypothetical protein